MKESEANTIKEDNLIQETEENTIDKKSDEEVVNWREECIKGNLMPGVLLLEQKKISVNDIVNPDNGNTLLHYAANFGFYNVVRTLIEKFDADVNIQNKAGFSPLFLIVSNTDTNIFNFHYLLKTEKIDFSLKDSNGLNIFPFFSNNIILITIFSIFITTFFSI